MGTSWVMSQVESTSTPAPSPGKTSWVSPAPGLTLVKLCKNLTQQF